MWTVASLLNPCSCNSLWKCHCSRASGSAEKSLNLNKASQDIQISMTMPMPLKQCCDDDRSSSCTSRSDGGITVSRAQIPTPSAQSYPEQRNMASISYTNWSHVQPFDPSIPTPPPRDPPPKQQHKDSLVLPPLVSLGDESDDVCLPTLPSFKKVCASVLDTGNVDVAALFTRCGCGSTCACPGCKE